MTIESTAWSFKKSSAIPDWLTALSWLMTHRCCAICEAFFYQCSIKFEIPPGVCGLIDFGLLKDWSRSIKPKASGMARNTKAIHSSEITNLMLFLSLRALLLLKCSNVFFAHPAVITQPPSEPFINYAQGGITFTWDTLNSIHLGWLSMQIIIIIINPVSNGTSWSSRPLDFRH